MGVWSLSHWATREVPVGGLQSQSQAGLKRLSTHANAGGLEQLEVPVSHGPAPRGRRPQQAAVTTAPLVVLLSRWSAPLPVGPCPTRPTVKERPFGAPFSQPSAEWVKRWIPAFSPGASRSRSLRPAGELGEPRERAGGASCRAPSPRQGRLLAEPGLAARGWTPRSRLCDLPVAAACVGRGLRERAPSLGRRRSRKASGALGAWVPQRGQLGRAWGPAPRTAG